MSFHHTALDVSHQLWSAPATPERKTQTRNQIPIRLFLCNYEIENKRRLLTSDTLQMFLLRNILRVSEKTSMSQIWLTFAQVLKMISACYPHSLYTTIILLYNNYWPSRFILVLFYWWYLFERFTVSFEKNYPYIIYTQKCKGIHSNPSKWRNCSRNICSAECT